jgi:hypothetical protein
MLILRDQPGVRTPGFISLEAASGHHIARPKEVRGSKPPYTILLSQGAGLQLLQC